MLSNGLKNSKKSLHGLFERRKMTFGTCTSPYSLLPRIANWFFKMADPRWRTCDHDSLRNTLGYFTDPQGNVRKFSNT